MDPPKRECRPTLPKLEVIQAGRKIHNQRMLITWQGDNFNKRVLDDYIRVYTKHDNAEIKIAHETDPDKPLATHAAIDLYGPWQCTKLEPFQFDVRVPPTIRSVKDVRIWRQVLCYLDGIDTRCQTLISSLERPVLAPTAKKALPKLITRESELKYWQVDVIKMIDDARLASKRDMRVNLVIIHPGCGLKTLLDMLSKSDRNIHYQQGVPRAGEMSPVPLFRKKEDDTTEPSIATSKTLIVNMGYIDCSDERDDALSELIRDAHRSMEHSSVWIFSNILLREMATLSQYTWEAYRIEADWSRDRVHSLRAFDLPTKQVRSRRKIV